MADAVSDEEKIEITLGCNRTATLDGIKNSVTRLAWFNEERRLMSSEGADVTVETMMTGLGQSSVAAHNGTMERVSDRESSCSGSNLSSQLTCPDLPERPQNWL